MQYTRDGPKGCFYIEKAKQEGETMEDYITRPEHEEFCKRLEADNKRQDKRIELLEANTRQINSLATSVEKLALSIQNMVREQEQQGKRLEALEGRDGEMWRKAVSYALTAIISAVVGYALRQIGM